MGVPAVANPFTITDCEIDVPFFLNPFQRLAIGTTSDALRCQQSGALYLAISDQSAGLFKPVAAQICFGPDALAPYLKHRVNVFVAQMRPQQLAAEEWRIADDEFGARPSWLFGVFGVAQVEDRIGVLDALEWVQNGVAVAQEAVELHPLQVADPDDNLC